LGKLKEKVLLAEIAAADGEEGNNGVGNSAAAGGKEMSNMGNSGDHHNDFKSGILEEIVDHVLDVNRVASGILATQSCVNDNILGSRLRPSSAGHHATAPANFSRSRPGTAPAGGRPGTAPAGGRPGTAKKKHPPLSHVPGQDKPIPKSMRAVDNTAGENEVKRNELQLKNAMYKSGGVTGSGGDLFMRNARMSRGRHYLVAMESLMYGEGGAAGKVGIDGEGKEGIGGGGGGDGNAVENLDLVQEFFPQATLGMLSQTPVSPKKTVQRSLTAAITAPNASENLSPSGGTKPATSASQLLTSNQSMNSPHVALFHKEQTHHAVSLTASPPKPQQHAAILNSHILADTHGRDPLPGVSKHMDREFLFDASGWGYKKLWFLEESDDEDLLVDFQAPPSPGEGSVSNSSPGSSNNNSPGVNGNNSPGSASSPNASIANPFSVQPKRPPPKMLGGSLLHQFAKVESKREEEKKAHDAITHAKELAEKGFLPYTPEVQKEMLNGEVRQKNM
jgi:hypothetical protein